MTHAGARYSFSRADRLVGRHAFAAVFAHKCSAAGQYFQVYAKPNPGSHPRLGITVTKRYVPLASTRNFCKRVARETFRTSREGLGGVDLVVRARSVVSAASSTQARVEILDLMRRASRQCNAATAALSR